MATDLGEFWGDWRFAVSVDDRRVGDSSPGDAKGVRQMLGCQLWVNLPAKDKMTHPAYHDILSEDVSVVEERDATVRVLSGSYKGHKGAVSGDYVKVQYLDVELKADSLWSYRETPNNHTLVFIPD